MADILAEHKVGNLSCCESFSPDLSGVFWTVLVDLSSCDTNIDELISEVKSLDIVRGVKIARPQSGKILVGNISEGITVADKVRNLTMPSITTSNPVAAGVVDLAGRRLPSHRRPIYKR